MPLPSSIQITHLTEPEEGAVIITKCPKCLIVQFVYCSLALKREDGSRWLMTIECDCCAQSLPFPLEFPIVTGLTV